MLATQLSEAISTARSMAMLDNAARLTWRGLAEGLIDEMTAERLSAVTEARRMALKGLGGQILPKASPARPRPCRSPDRARSISRRRHLASSGAVPGPIAASFTTGELAALTVIARECQRSGACRWFMDRIAAVSGVSRTTARNALRQAQALGLITVRERRRRGWRSDSNIIHIIAQEWLAWLRLGGGCKKLKSTNTDSNPTSLPSLNNGDLFRVRSGAGTGAPIYPMHGNRLSRASPDIRSDRAS